jgi:hypothetical protein
MIISFAQTTPAIRDKSKKVTRRFWADSYAKKFKAGTIHQAWDRSPRTGKGKRIGEIMISREPYKQALCMMTEEDFQKEGGARFWTDRQNFIECMGGPTAIPWVIEFNVLWADQR